MAIKKILALFALFIFSTPAFAQGFGSPNGVGFPSTSSGSGSSPLTTKGDVFTFSTVNTRLPVGTNGQLLSADNTQATGLKWITASGTGTVTSFSSNNLSPLFTTSVATGTTTPVLSFALSNAGAHTYFGNNTGSSTAPSFLTNTQLTADLNVFTSSLQGVVPASGGGTTNFLRADGTWAAPAGGGGGLTSPVGIADGGTGQTSQTAAFDALSPNTTGGDITYHNGTNNVRLAVGKDETRLGITSGSPSYLYPAVEPSIWLPLRVYGGFIVNRPNSGNATQPIGTQASFNIGGTTTAATDTDGMFVKATTAATTNSDALCTSNAGVIRRDTAPRVWCHFKTGASISVCRIWVGLMNADLSAITSPTTADVAAIRYDTGAGDTTLKLVTCDAGGTATVTDTGITPAILTDYSVCFDLLDTSKLNVYICASGAVATKVGPVSATLPRSGAIDLSTTLSIRTLENVAKEIRFGSFAWTQKG